MPDINKTREVLETAFIAGWSDTTPTKFDNVVFNDKDIDAYVAVKMINYTSKNVTVGSAIQKRIRHRGVFAVKIYIKQNISSITAYEYAKQVSDFMSNLIQSNLFTEASETRRNGEAEDGWYSLIVDTPYTSDEE